MDLLDVSRDLSRELAGLRFGAPVSHVYNPLVYAAAAYRAYVLAYGAMPKEVVFVGMNPGPWGMAQTGVPFGDAEVVSGWLGIRERVERPGAEHPKRPVLGFSCRRREVSGRRLWGWARNRFGTADRFFARFFVANYCPLLFLEESGRNRTPDRLPQEEQRSLQAACDRALVRTVEYLRPRWVIGVGKYAERRCRAALGGVPVEVGCILHPSPASPAANRGWEATVDGQLAELGIRFPWKAPGTTG